MAQATARASTSASGSGSASASRLPRSFFARPTLEIARDLLGARLVRRRPGERSSARIVEVEAYIGEDDTACHAAKGRTARNEPMFGPPGHAYVYFTYGLHWMLNVVTEAEGRPAAVLIRAAEPLSGLGAMRRRRLGRRDEDLLRGPACLTAALAIDRALDRADLVRGADLFLVRAAPLPAERVGTSPRIGIDYAHPRDRDAPWRFFDLASPSVSGPRPRSRPRRLST